MTSAGGRAKEAPCTHSTGGLTWSASNINFTSKLNYDRWNLSHYGDVPGDIVDFLNQAPTKVQR